MNKRESLMQRLRKLLGEAPGMELLNPNLLFGSAWFWTLPEVQEAQREIDARNANFRRYLGIDKGFGEIAKEADAQTPLTIEALHSDFKIVDANGQAVAYKHPA